MIDVPDNAAGRGVCRRHRGERSCRFFGRRPRKRPERRRGPKPPELAWPQQADGCQEGDGPASVPASVPRLHADHPARGGRGEPGRHGRRGYRVGPVRPHPLQRSDRAAPRGKGRGECQGPLADDEDHRARTSRRPGHRGGRQAAEVPPEHLGPGGVVLVEAGNRVPADGRVCVAATLEIEEAALTGESLPVGKSLAPVPGENIPLCDRTCMVYMNTAVTRGRGEFVVTATGMDTQIGHIADMLANTTTDKTPLQKQLDGLSKIIAVIAGIALIFVVLLGLLRGESFDTLFITGVALAVAAIPTGLPAVVTALLSMGTREIARRNAIVKRLPAVETLGSTSAICSDKTGTLTLNKMTARELVIPGQNRYTVSGEGYSTEGEISHVGGQHHDLDPYLLPMVLCAVAVLDGDSLIGDPTEGALIVLGAKGGLDVTETRAALPRVAEVL